MPLGEIDQQVGKQGRAGRTEAQARDGLRQDRGCLDVVAQQRLALRQALHGTRPFRLAHADLLDDAQPFARVANRLRAICEIGEQRTDDIEQLALQARLLLEGGVDLAGTTLDELPHRQTSELGAGCFIEAAELEETGEEGLDRGGMRRLLSRDPRLAPRQPRLPQRDSRAGGDRRQHGDLRHRARRHRDHDGGADRGLELVPAHPALGPIPGGIGTRANGLAAR